MGSVSQVHWDETTLTFSLNGSLSGSKIDLRFGKDLVSNDDTPDMEVSPMVEMVSRVLDNAVGGAENDVLIGNFKANALAGGAGNDRLQGEDGDDLLLGEGGNDRLFGGAGDDSLEGGEGRDVLVGGEGDDEFIFAEETDSFGRGSFDRIKGVDGVGEEGGDVINLDGIDANSAVDGDQSFDFVDADRADTSQAGLLWVVEARGGKSKLLGTTDDDAGVDFTVILRDGDTLASDYTADDFIL